MGESTRAAGASQQCAEYLVGDGDAWGPRTEYAIYGCYYRSRLGDPAYGHRGRTFAPVGTAFLGAGLWGQLDLAGEVWEWNLDWYATYAAGADCARLHQPPPPRGGPGAATSSLARAGIFSPRLATTSTRKTAASDSVCVAPGPHSRDRQ